MAFDNQAVWGVSLWRLSSFNKLEEARDGKFETINVLCQPEALQATHLMQLGSMNSVSSKQ